MDRGQGTDARELLLRSFEWTDGHANFADALRDPDLVRAIGPALAGPFADERVTAVLGIEARGFVIASLVARELGVGLVLARKPGSVHPDADHEIAATPDWRGRNVELRISRRAVRHDDRVLLADDWIETGSQARAAAKIVRRLGGDLVGSTVLVDDTTDAVRHELNVVGLVRTSELPPAD